MPVTYTIVPELRIVILIYSGTIRVQDSAEALLRCVREPDYDPAMDLLLDLDHCTYAEGAFRDMLRLARRLDPWYANRRSDTHVAIWARDDVNFGVARMYQMTVEGRNPAQVGVFRSREEALDFIDRDAETRARIEQRLDAVRASDPRQG